MNHNTVMHANARAIAILAGYLRVDNTKMSLFSLGGVIFGDKLKFYDWMKSKGLLATRKECLKCGNGTQMLFQERTEQGGTKDGYTWRCPVCHSYKTHRLRFHKYGKNKINADYYPICTYLAKRWRESPICTHLAKRWRESRAWKAGGSW